MIWVAFLIVFVKLVLLENDISDQMEDIMAQLDDLQAGISAAVVSLEAAKVAEAAAFARLQAKIDALGTPADLGPAILAVADLKSKADELTTSADATGL